MADHIEIEPTVGPLRGTIDLPGSKSITNRALLVAALASGETKLKGCLISDDTQYMISALNKMGVKVSHLTETTLLVNSNGTLQAPEGPIFLGNAGTATRFLTAACALVKGTVVVDGDSHMRKRPIQPLLDSLSQLGVSASSTTGCPPVTIHGEGKFSGDKVLVDGALSSQYTSAMLMLSACGNNATTVELKENNIDAAGYIDITLDVMKSFGAEVELIKPGAWRINPTGYKSRDFEIEPDMSAATYMWAAEALTQGSIQSSVEFKNSLQPDFMAKAVIASFPDMPEVIDGSQIQDSIPTLAVMAIFNNNPVRFTGIKNLRVKECDRIKALCDGLRKISENLAEEDGDDLLVFGSPSLSHSSVDATINTYDDHRIAMSFALAGLLISGIKISNPDCVQKTFPSYWEMLGSLGVQLKRA